MQTLRDSINYTLNKKKEQLADQEFYDEQIEELEDYLEDTEERSTVGLDLGFLSSWYNWKFNNSFISTKIVDYESISLSLIHGYESNLWGFSVGLLSEKFITSCRFVDSTEHLAQLMYLGWNDMAVSYGHLIIQMLYGKHYKGGVDYPVHQWFIIELFCKWQNIELDKSKLNYPQDLGVYEEALAHWDSNDTQKISTIVGTLSNFHIKQSDEYVTTDEFGNEGSPDFSNSDYFIFPIEILMWLAVRRNLKLPDYTPTADNELMQLEINKLPTINIPIPKIELIEKCKEKLKRDNPNVKLIW